MSNVGRLLLCVVAVICLSAACAKPIRIPYELPQLAVVPPGAKPVVDERSDFADRFCGVLQHTPDGAGSWKPCTEEPYLHLDHAAQPKPTSHNDRFLQTHGVLVVGGIFARCADVPVFKDAEVHLQEHGIVLEHVPVFGNGSSEQNAAVIKEYLARQDPQRRYVAVGHSKGAVDLLEAIVHHPEVRQRVDALITVASPVAGSRLVDGVPALLKGLAQEMPDLGTCPLGDGIGPHSLARPTRQRFLRDHITPINDLRSYGIVAVSTLERTSDILRGLWRFLEKYSIDQDSHVIAEEALLPGTTLLARANGDHWAVAFPAETSTSSVLRNGSTWNHYPRTALLETALRFAAEDLAR